MNRTLASLASAALVAAACLGAPARADTNFAYRIDCEVQNASGYLEPLVWEQGTTPLVELYVTQRGRAVELPKETTARMVVGVSAISNRFAMVTNDAPPVGNAILLQWPSIGTNTMETGSWWYTVIFADGEGHDYWTGSGSLDIEATLANGEDGLIWQYYADSTERVTYITTNNTVYVATNLQEYVQSINGQTGEVRLDYLPAVPDEESEEEDAYAVENPTAFRKPLVAPDYLFNPDWSATTILSPFSSVTNNGLSRYRSRSRAFSSGLVLNSDEGSFLRMSLGDFGWLLFSRESAGDGHRTKAELKADTIETKGKSVTIRAEVYDEEEDETVPGPVVLDGNVSVPQGGLAVAGDVQADSLTLTNGTWTAWPDLAAATNFPSALRALLDGVCATYPATNLYSAIARANAIWEALDAAAPRREDVPGPSSPGASGAAAPSSAEPVGQWVMHEAGGKIVNGGTDGGGGDLRRLEGAALSTSVPEVNFVGGEPQGASLALSSTVSGTAAAESADAYDPLAGAGAFTIMAWVRRTGSGDTAARIVSDVSSKTGGSGVELRFSGSSGFLTLHLNDNTDVTAPAGGIAPGEGEWHHVAVSYDGSRATGGNVHFYVDAVQQGAGTTLAGKTVEGNSVPLTIGNSSAGRVALSQFIGEIDDVHIFRGWSPEPPGSGQRCAGVAEWMALCDDAIIPPRDPAEAVELGATDPDTTVYSAQQVDDLLAGKGDASREWIADNYLPANQETRGGRDKTGNPVRIPYYDVPHDVQLGKLGLDGDFIESWRDFKGQLRGPNWLTPARFSWIATVATTVTTNVGPETDGHYAVRTRAREVVTEKEYVLDPSIERNQWDEPLKVSVDGPASLSPVGDGTYLLSWDEGAPTGTTAKVSGQLGEWRDSKTVTLTESGNVLTQQWFSSFAPGGVREALADVLAAWTNMSGGIYRFTNFSVGKTSTVETLTLHPNTNFWARNCDLSGVSVWNSNGGYYYTQPATLVASNICYGAAHWSIAIGKTLAWYGKDGQIHSAKIVDQRRMTGDLCVSKISPPLDTNAVTAYPILDQDAIRNKIRAADFGAVYGLPLMPVLAMSQAERAWIMQSSNLGGGTGGIFDSVAKEYIRNSRNCAVGGDSGHPVFVSTDATNLVLIGCYWTPNGLSVPGDQLNKPLVSAAVEAMGGDPDAIRWEGWTNWPTYLGPLSM